MDALGEGAVEDARKHGEITKCIIVRCWESKTIFAHVVPCKGHDEEAYVANLLTDDIAWLGYSTMIMKADNENAIQAIVTAVIARVRARMGGSVTVRREEPPAYDSQANGGTEVGVRNVRGLFRTLKLCTESRINQHIPAGHPITAWLLGHTCMLLNARARGPDGLTAWQRIKGREFGQKLMGFLEAVLWKLPVKGPVSAPHGNMGARFMEGIFLGYSRTSNVYVVSTPEGIKHTRSLKRRPILNRWIPERVMAIAATPWSEREKPEPPIFPAEGPAIAGATSPRMHPDSRDSSRSASKILKNTDTHQHAQYAIGSKPTVRPEVVTRTPHDAPWGS